MKYISVIFVSLILSSCIPEESPITPIDRGDLEVVLLTNSMYDYTSYFSLQDAAFIKDHDQFNWHLAYDCEADSHYVRINTGKSMRAISIGNMNFDDAQQSDAADTLFIDDPAGFGDGTVIGNWWNGELIDGKSVSDVFVLNAGFNSRRRPQGFYKLQLKLIDENTIEVTYQKFGGEKQVATLTKNNSYNYVYLHFDNPDEQILNEPMKTNYDLIFTSKSEYVAFDDEFPEDNTQYQVRGVYSNPYLVETAQLDNTDEIEFQDIVYQDVSNIEFSKAQNIIGYDWKDFTIDSDLYQVNFKDYYIIKSQSGFLYKMRFIKFYDSTGARGYPEFEIKRL